MKTLKTCKTGCGKMKSGGAVKKVKKMAQGGQMYGIPQTGTTNYSAPTMKKGGTLKPVPSDQKGLAKLPTAVRNKMGYQKKGGTVKRK
jgi:hypothetical protein